MSRVRAIFLLTAFLLFTLPLMLVQWGLIAVGSRFQRTFPHWYHRQVCRLLGVRIGVKGRLAAGKSVLIVANHVSWLDIPVLSAIAPLSFIAKRQIGGWPFIGWLAKLQRSVFVDRERRTSVNDQRDLIRSRLAGAENIVLFAEGTTGEGGRILPFKSSLFGVLGFNGASQNGVVIQTLTIAYTRLHGLPIGRGERPNVAWYGDMEAAGHAFALLGIGPVDVEIRIGEPIDLALFPDRKALAEFTEVEIGRTFRGLVRPSLAKPAALDAPAGNG